MNISLKIDCSYFYLRVKISDYSTIIFLQTIGEDIEKEIFHNILFPIATSEHFWWVKNAYGLNPKEEKEYDPIPF